MSTRSNRVGIASAQQLVIFTELATMDFADDEFGERSFEKVHTN